MRHFVQHLGAVLQRSRAAGNKVDGLLWAATKHGVRSLVVVMGVYTRNRAMRLYLSCKHGKRAVLMPALRNRFAMPWSGDSDGVAAVPDGGGPSRAGDVVVGSV